LFSFSDIWKVIVISGVYTHDEPPDTSSESKVDSERLAADDDNADDNSHSKTAEEGNPDGETANEDNGESKVEDSERLDEEEEGVNNEDEKDKEIEDKDGNTNNNALDGNDSEDEDNPADGKPATVRNEARPHPPNSQLGIVIYGDLGKSALLPLVTDKPASFLPGMPDEFHVSYFIKFFTRD
jgi:hypothetical protein